MNQRVIDIINYKNLTPSKFADMIGVPRSTISHIISGRNNPSLELITKITDKFPDIRIDWLIKGKGSMLRVQTSLFDYADDDYQNDKKRPLEPSKSIESKKSLTESEKSNKIDNIEKPNEEKILENSKDVEPNSANNKKINQELKQLSKIILIFDDNTFEIVLPGSDKS